MPNEFRMPSLGPDMESGTLVEWRVKVGDVVKRGDIVALIETDKGVIDVEIFADGTIDKLLVEQGAHVPVGTVLAQLNGAGGPEPARMPTPVAASVSAPAAQTETSAARGAAPLAAVGDASVSERTRHKASPAARARARELGVDLSQVAGTGLGHAITIDDVIRAASSRAATERARPAPAHDMRQVIARAMSRSKREVPHYYLSLTCSFAPAHAFLESHNATCSIESRLLPSAVMLKAVALAAKVMPDFNGFFKDDEFHPSTAVHVGMAIAMRGGRLVAPAILDADDNPLAAVMSELRDLATRVRAGHMKSSELAMPTITLTALADEGVDAIIPVIYPPQVAIVGIGSILERPWVVGGSVQATRIVTLTLAADHRVTDGRAGARFLACIRDALQTPEKL